jgi:hypothetical protein
MQERQPTTPLFPPVNVTTTATTTAGVERVESDHIRLLRDILAAQDRQNELMEELVSQLGAAQRQRNQELAQWKAANPELAQNCRAAAESLSRVQTSFLQTLTEEVNDNADGLADGEFLLSEFVDRFGPRLAHLNGVLQVLAQLSGPGAT